MALDPAFRTVLDTLERADAVPLVRDGDALATRAHYRELSMARRGPGFVPEEVADVADGEFPGGPDHHIPVRSYRPAEDTGAIVVYLHGGGWVVGDLDTHDPVCRRVANATGATVVSVDYSLAPEHPHPAALDDAEMVLRYLSASAYGRPIGVAGDSAGASLAAGLAVRAARGGGMRVDAQLLFYPATDPTGSHPSVAENGHGYFLTAADMAFFWEQYLPGGAGATDPDIALLGTDVRGVAPAVIATAEFDPLRDEGRAYADQLERAGVTVHRVEGPGLIHGFAAFLGVVDAADTVVASALAAFRDLLA
ncbi:alpha/beta hydrolase [Pseudonocardia endophytica]|uniref:Acetyl esterase n=1 Tax=Pseudonocardia endophytica TaxID=401976 RepID=A0A4R1HKN8_PSEEN|nr:alpha/beta hydrolase [Pseudonocardia endophytica]TCK22974.1 acetyl esterase [Pseudonocardia endophytica]